MAVLLALVSAISYGVSDFLGGVFSRRAGSWQIAVMGQVSAAVLTIVVALLVTGDSTGRDMAFGAVAGVSSGAGLAFLYRGFTRGRIGVVAPVSAVGSALVPVVVGLVQGDRPSGWVLVGIVCAFPAIWLVAREVDGSGSGSAGFVDGVLAGLGFGGMFALLGQVGDDSGYAPLAALQTFAIVGVVLAAMSLRQPWLPRRRSALWGIALGPLGFVAAGAFWLATHHGLLSVVSVLAALYPAVTVLCAVALLKEHIHRRQAVGLVAAALSVMLVALG